MQQPVVLSSPTRFLTRHAFLPLGLASSLAMIFLFGRILMTDSGAYVFLVWNLFLAWLPYLFSLAAARLHERAPGRWWLVAFPGALWLLFFPNAPYIMTDLVHLWRIPPAIWWYDIGLIAAFAWAGCFLAVASLAAMQAIVRDYTGVVAGWLFVLATVGLGGLGVYLGRFVRLNSWDLLFTPRHVVGQIVDSLAHPLAEPRAFGVSAMFAALLLVCYLMFSTRDPGGRI